MKSLVDIVTLLLLINTCNMFGMLEDIYRKSEIKFPQDILKFEKINACDVIKKSFCNSGKNKVICKYNNKKLRTIIGKIYQEIKIQGYSFVKINNKRVTLNKYNFLSSLKKEIIRIFTKKTDSIRGFSQDIAERCCYPPDNGYNNDVSTIDRACFPACCFCSTCICTCLIFLFTFFEAIPALFYFVCFGFPFPDTFKEILMYQPIVLVALAIIAGLGGMILCCTLCTHYSIVRCLERNAKSFSKDLKHKQLRLIKQIEKILLELEVNYDLHDSYEISISDPSSTASSSSDTNYSLSGIDTSELYSALSSSDTDNSRSESEVDFKILK